MKKKIFYLVILLCGLGALAYFQLTVEGNQDNGFDRKMLSQKLRLEQVHKFEYDVFFSWKPEDHIYLSSRFQPLRLMKLDDSLKIEKGENLMVPPLFNKKLHNFYFSKSDSIVFVLNEIGQIARIGRKTKQVFSIPAVFDNPAALSKNSVVVRLFKSSKQGNRTELSKIILSRRTALITKSFSVPKLTDGIFCSDGLLQYDKNSQRLFYMYYRRGEFLSLDTNLNLIYSAQTVDTIRHPNMKFILSNNQSKKDKSLHAPNELVNKYFTISGTRLYILSGLRADNQSLTDFFSNGTIDVYAVKNGTYLYSFKLHRYKGLLLRQFHVINNHLFAKYDQHLLKYAIHPANFPK